jgi:NAD-dependent SIR2 family protein deacetylase
MLGQFQLLENHGEGYKDWECQTCGEVFLTSEEELINVVYLEDYRQLVQKCPSCGSYGEAI